MARALANHSHEPQAVRQSAFNLARIASPTVLSWIPLPSIKTADLENTISKCVQFYHKLACLILVRDDIFMQRGYWETLSACVRHASSTLSWLAALPGKTEQLVDNSPRDFSWAYFIAEIQRNSNVFSVMSPAGCSHVNGFKVDNWKQNLRVIYQCFVWSGSAETRKRKVNKITRAQWCNASVPSRTSLSNTNGCVIRQANVIYFHRPSLCAR